MACENLFRKIKHNADDLGMLVNEDKTRMICLSSAVNCKVESFIVTPNNTVIRNSKDMVLLGFSFDSRPLVAAHLELIKRKFNIRIWLIRHLLAAGVSKLDVSKIYAAVIRPRHKTMKLRYCREDA